jgi:hypothetical protein
MAFPAASAPAASLGGTTIGLAGTPTPPAGSTPAVAPIQEAVNTVAHSGAAQTIPDVAHETINSITLTADCALTFPAAAAGKSFLLALIQDATGGRTVTWPAVAKWAGGTAPSLTAAAGATDLISFICTDGTNWLGVVAGQAY